MEYSVIIIGGGLAGLGSSIELAHAGVSVLLIEKKSYPFHKVCGEYISNEVKPYLQTLGLDLGKLNISNLTQFQLTSPKGLALHTELDLGGFGVSRFALDHALYQLAVNAGVEFRLDTSVTSVFWKDKYFEIETTDQESFRAEVVIGAYGKRTRLDKQLGRHFMEKASPYVGVKYHIRYNFPKNVIALHNFKNGYCGISAIEDDKFCLCYLTERSNMKKAGSINAMEKTIASRNPYLRDIFTSAEFLYDKPEVINEVSFAPKKSIENHILMVGDSAGLVTPLCGNGMAIAIRSGNMAAQEIIRYFTGHRNRATLETNYQDAWEKEFATRLLIGRTVQQLFGKEFLTEMALRFFSITPTLLQKVIKSTHGKVMKI